MEFHSYSSPDWAIYASGNSTSNDTISQGLGFAACGVSVLFFGSNFVPVKQFATGDGFFFQWVLASAIFLVGLIVHAIRHFPTFHALAMFGGWCWATGNVLTVMIIKTIGLSQGLLIWGMFNCLMGWASGTFGWFGLHAHVGEITDKAMNYCGVTLAVLSAFVYMFVKSNVSESSQTAPSPPQTAPLDASTGDFSSTENLVESEQNSRADILTFRRTPKPQNVSGSQSEAPEEPSIVERLPVPAKRAFGIIASMVAGTLYGVNFAPVIYVQENVKGASDKGLDYVFAHYTGIYLTATVYFLIYCIVKKNKPQVFPKAILPGFVSGAMWAVAQTAWFIANEALSQSISFPIITSGPCIVAAVIGILVYKEIQGLKNYIILSVVFCLAVTGSLLVAFSKDS